MLTSDLRQMCSDIVDSGITEATMEITATAYGKLNRVDLKDVASEEGDLEVEIYSQTRNRQ